MRKDAENVIKVSEAPNMIKAIATAMLKTSAVYYCTIGGVRTAVVKD